MLMFRSLKQIYKVAQIWPAGKKAPLTPSVTSVSLSDFVFSTILILFLLLPSLVKHTNLGKMKVTMPMPVSSS